MLPEWQSSKSNNFSIISQTNIHSYYYFYFYLLTWNMIVHSKSLLIFAAVSPCRCLSKSLLGLQNRLKIPNFQAQSTLLVLVGLLTWKLQLPELCSLTYTAPKVFFPPPRENQMNFKWAKPFPDWDIYACQLWWAALLCHELTAFLQCLAKYLQPEFSKKVSRKRVEAYIHILFHAYFDLPRNA